jgi:hypothetical protein
LVDLLLFLKVYLILLGLDDVSLEESIGSFAIELLKRTGNFL